MMPVKINDRDRLPLNAVLYKPMYYATSSLSGIVDWIGA